MAGYVLRCPACRPVIVRRRDGSRIVGFEPEALYYGVLKLPRRFPSFLTRTTCPNCGSPLRRAQEVRA